MREYSVRDSEGTIIEQCTEYDVPGDEDALLAALIAWTEGEDE